MSLAALLVALALPLVSGHSYVQYITTGKQNISTYLPYDDPWDEIPKITRPFSNNSPVEDVDSPIVACNVQTDKSASASQPAPIHATIAAGDELTFHWEDFPESHKGPTLTYLARCPDRCEDYVLDGGEPIWFKIDEAGWYGDRNFATGSIAKTGQWSGVQIPRTLKPGAYLLRHEAISLHAAEEIGGAQLYMQCHQFEITGTGTELPDPDTLVGFPGAYKATDPGLHINIYWPALTKYTIPGPPVWTGGFSNAVPHDIDPDQFATESTSSTDRTPSTGRMPTNGTIRNTGTVQPTGNGGYHHSIDPVVFSSHAASLRAALISVTSGMLLAVSLVRG